MNNFNIVKIIITILISLLIYAGCTSKENQAKNEKEEPSTIQVYEKQPKWYINSPLNTKTKLYGIGEGDSIKEAKINALNDLSSRLMVTVDSNIESIKRSSATQYEKEIKQEIKVEVEKIKYINTIVEKQENINGKSFVLISLDRKKLFKDQYNNFDRVDNMILQTYNNVKNKSNFMQIVELEGLKPSIKENTKSALLLYAINEDFEYFTYQKRYDNYLSKLKSLKTNLTIRFVDNKKDKYFYNALKRFITKNGYKLVSTKGDIEIKLDNNFVNSKTKGWNITKSTSSISITTSDMPLALHDKIISSTLIDSVGRSSVSIELAKSDASKDFLNSLEEIGIEKVLFNKE